MSSFKETLSRMLLQGMKLPGQKVSFTIPDARKKVEEALIYFLALEGKTPVWLPEYDGVVDWLTGNRGRGLFLYGNCGRGKSLMCRYVIPAILLQCCAKVVSVYDVQDMNRSLDDLLTKHILALDDIGTEEVLNQYGNRRMAFAEIMDAAEKNGKLVIISTNLQAREIKERYGDRILDRILSTTTRVLFEGRSMRE